jgi:hypothetical protein
MKSVKLEITRPLLRLWDMAIVVLSVIAGVLLALALILFVLLVLQGCGNDTAQDGVTLWLDSVVLYEVVGGSGHDGSVDVLLEGTAQCMTERFGTVYPLQPVLIRVTSGFMSCGETKAVGCFDGSTRTVWMHKDYLYSATLTHEFVHVSLHDNAIPDTGHNHPALQTWLHQGCVWNYLAGTP